MPYIEFKLRNAERQNKQPYNEICQGQLLILSVFIALLVLNRCERKKKDGKKGAGEGSKEENPERVSAPESCIMINNSFFKC